MRIFHPRPQIGRQKFIGVEFRGGVAEADELHPERRVALEQHGFLIQFDDGTVSAPGDWPLPLPEPLIAPAEPTPLADLTVAELREIAEFEGVQVPKGAKKADIVAALDEQRDELAATPAEVAALDELAGELRHSVDGETFIPAGPEAEARNAAILDEVRERLDSAGDEV